MYGSVRIGIRKPVEDESEQQVNFSAGYSGLLFNNVAYGALPPVNSCTDACALTRTVGKKEFEFTNHLGNVLETVTDIHLPSGNATAHSVDYYVSDVIGYSDYFVFGSTQSNRAGGDYRYQFNGQEEDIEVGEGVQTAMFWEYDSRLGRRWNPDPVIDPTLSSYCVFGNTPLACTDFNGDVIVIHFDDIELVNREKAFKVFMEALDDMFHGKVEFTYSRSNYGGYEKDGMQVNGCGIKCTKSSDGQDVPMELTKEEQVKYNYISYLIGGVGQYADGAIGYEHHLNESNLTSTTDPRTHIGSQPFGYNIHTPSNVLHQDYLDPYDFVIHAASLEQGTPLVSRGDYLFLILTGLRNNGNVDLALFNRGTGLQAVESQLVEGGAFTMILKSQDALLYKRYHVIHGQHTEINAARQIHYRKKSRKK